MTSSIKELVRDQEWQKVRIKLLGKWADDPIWCCNQLHIYLGSLKTTSDDKLRIVMNYLVGTGFRTGRIKNKCISELRKMISLEIQDRKK